MLSPRLFADSDTAPPLLSTVDAEAWSLAELHSLDSDTPSGETRFGDRSVVILLCVGEDMKWSRLAIL